MMNAEETMKYNICRDVFSDFNQSKVDCLMNAVPVNPHEAMILLMGNSWDVEVARDAFFYAN